MPSKRKIPKLALTVGFLCCFLSGNFRVLAQIIPDNTSDKIISIDEKDNIIRISDGNVSQNSLFYSFLEFNVDSNKGVYFIDAGVENIIARVLDKYSTIDGTLGIEGGNANLFLINPNGIVFGKNAQLDLKGSFLASTADSIVFDDGSEFSVTNPQSPPLLTLNVPIGLRFGEIPGTIINNSTKIVRNRSRRLISAGLGVSAGNSIALVGGDISMDGGFIFAPGAKVEIGSVAGNSFVYLTQELSDLNFGYEDVQAFGDINFNNNARIQTGLASGGDIHLQGQSITISNSDIEAFSNSETPGGNISIDAAQSILLADSSITSGNLSLATGSSGDINIDAKSIFIQNSIIDASSDSEGASGNTIIKASELLSIDSSFITAKALGNSSAGIIQLEAENLTLNNGAEVTVSSPNGGVAGSLEIKSDSLLLNDASKISAETNGGKVGNIIIDSGNVILRGNSKITTSAIESPAKTEGGNIAITADSLILDNSNISANSTNSFGGRVNINAAGIFRSPNSSITATSEAGPQFNGIVNLDITNVDPTQGLTELPSYIVDPDSLVAQNPCKRGSESEFTRSGRGGLPPSVSQDFDSDATQVGLVAPVQTSTVDRQQAKTLEGKMGSLASVSTPIVPAQGWVFNDKGEVVLVADNSAIAGSQRLKANPAGCPVR